MIFKINNFDNYFKFRQAPLILNLNFAPRMQCLRLGIGACARGLTGAEGLEWGVALLRGKQPLVELHGRKKSCNFFSILNLFNSLYIL